MVGSKVERDGVAPVLASRHMSTRRLSRVTLGATVALVTLGAYTRGSGSGFGCEDRWPLCENGLLGGLLPRADFHMIVEWSHRWLAAIVGVLAVLTAVAAWRSARRWTAVVATAAVLVIGIQGWLGRLIVTQALDRDLVALHLFISMTIAGLLTVVVMATADRAVRASPGWAAWTGVGALLALALIVAGAYVHNLYIAGWPLVGGDLVPDLSNRFVAVHWLHRLLAALLLVYLAGLAVSARRTGRRDGTRLLDLALAAHILNIALGATHVFTEVSSSLLVAVHVLTAAVVWVALVAAAASAVPGAQADLLPG